MGRWEKKDGNSVEHKVTKKNEGSVKRQANCSKFENTLGLSAAGWDDFIEISHILKLPLSDKPWEASIAVNTLGEETASLVWNNFQLEREAAQETDQTICKKRPCCVASESGGQRRLALLEATSRRQEIPANTIEGHTGECCDNRCTRRCFCRTLGAHSVACEDYHPSAQ